MPHLTDRHLPLRDMRIVLSIGALLLLPRPADAQRIEPLFELFATYGRPALAPAVRDLYDAGGGVRAGGGVGAAAGVRIGPVEVAGFYEIGSSSIARAGSGRPSDFTRNTVGARFEVPLLELGREFRGLVSASVFQQRLDSVTVDAGAGTVIAPSQTGAFGGRIDLGIEHRGFIGTTWFVTGGVNAVRGGRGNWRRYTPDRGGFGVAPVVTIGLRTREW